MRVLFVGIIIILMLGVYIGYAFVWPEIMYSKIKAQPLPPAEEDPLGFRKALVENKDCVKEAWGRGTWAKYMRRPGPPSDELATKMLQCTEGGQKLIRNFEENKDCFIRWWGEATYNEFAAQPRVPSEDLTKQAWWCFPGLVREAYQDEERVRKFQEVQTVLLGNRSCFIQAWGEDLYRDYLKYPRKIEDADTEKARACFTVR